MYSIILNTLNIFMCYSVVDALINVITDVISRKVAAEITICSLVNFLVVTTVRVMDTTMLMSVSITIVAMSLLVVMIIVLLIDIMW